ncbi:hypothetical protein [Streptomyces luteolus]|uniref:Uncharacterized protein n=1 Tax=Streptomyces luteolus TaxID=3043615 RepID=A0ABT6STW3_9ACTN|nr:hypothetical protein [Streptomyces sp. B-S-A12]MDI3419054.1 hypothetical protein [Streptomyces sp. B-S-A12]
MTDSGSSGQDEKPMVGTRTYVDVEQAQKRMSVEAAEPDPSPQFSNGVSTAYRWALGHADRAPVTGDGAADGVPDLQTLTAEVDAAAVQTENLTGLPEVREYSRGVHDALAWVCGHTHHAP